MNENNNPTDVNTYFKEIFTNAGIGIMTLDKNSSIEYINEEALNIFGYKTSELVNKNFSTLIHNTDQDYLKQYIDQANSSSPSEFMGIHKDNSAFPIELNISRKILNQSCVYTVIIRDITEFKKNEENLKHQAYFDSLTGIPNRTLFLDRSEIALNQAKRSKEGLAVIFIDLDEFKELNDTLGHDAGDVMLKTVAERFINCARKSDTVSRRGGDEFTILMPRIKNIEDAIKLAERILDSNKNAVTIKNNMVFPKTSIGISIFPEDGESIKTLINNADKAMYSAKESGKNQYSFYNS
ncbi:MAG: GGDEF domain-containing protein [Candidatus Marinimicrobia bacterium]|nr:GGDEF domain-containing protein [Candidatus Neomarinimicrobiota bacterium]